MTRLRAAAHLERPVEMVPLFENRTGQLLGPIGGHKSAMAIITHNPPVARYGRRHQGNAQRHRLEQCNAHSFLARRQHKKIGTAQHVAHVTGNTRHFNRVPGTNGQSSPLDPLFQRSTQWTFTDENQLSLRIPGSHQGPRVDQRIQPFLGREPPDKDRAWRPSPVGPALPGRLGNGHSIRDGHNPRLVGRWVPQFAQC